MSSEIVPGLDSMALAERAWHGYGTVVGRHMTYSEAMTLAGLDWTTRLAPLTALTPEGVVEVDTHRVTYRNDIGAVLGVVGPDYQPHQPAELLELARVTIDAAPTDTHVEVVGSLRGGRTVFITIALPDDIDIAGDVHMPRLVWVTSMDGTIATRAVSTYVRAVCANTIRASFRNARAEPDWLVPLIGPRLDDPIGATAWDAVLTDIVRWRITHRITSDGLGSAPDDPTLVSEWQALNGRCATTRTSLANSERHEPNWPIQRSYRELIERQHELELIL